jgi:hypothetical protein
LPLAALRLHVRPDRRELFEHAGDLAPERLVDVCGPGFDHAADGQRLESALGVALPLGAAKAATAAGRVEP